VGSLLIAVGGAMVVFAILARPTLPFNAAWLGVSCGGAISGMHYTAMAGMRLPAATQYTAALVLLSIAISMIFPVLGLRPLRTPNGGSPRSPVWLGASIATGIVGMHFTAMAATRFVQQPVLESAPSGDLLVASQQLAIMVFIGTAVMITLAELAVAISHQEDSQRAQLRALTSRVETAREAERAHIAREIHDELGQAMTVLKLDLERLRTTSGGEPNLGASIGGIQTTLADTMTAMGRLAAGLRPPVLDELGLGDGVRALAEEVEQRTGLRVRAQIELTERQSGAVERDVATAVYRILQETLTNVVRHANATAVEITLRVTPEGLHLEVSDNGQGITRGELDDPHSLGLLGMRERARGWGGEVVVTGVAGRGTTIVVTIPLPARRGAS
jgi:signal transduction histidine kinase